MSSEAVAPPLEETWKLEDLFADEESFDEAQRSVEADLESLSAFQGRLVETAATLADALDTIAALREQLQTLHCYASARSDVDTRDPAQQARRQEIELLSTRFAERVAFVGPEVTRAEEGLIAGYIDSEPRLADHAHGLRDLLRQRAHVLGASEERILAETGLFRRDSAQLYSLLTNAELPRPSVTLAGGETLRLTPAIFNKHRTTNKREDRLRLFPTYFTAYADFQETLGANLFSALKGHVFGARVRGYESCLAASLDPDNVPEPVYRNLVQQVHDHLPVLHRYFRLRSRALGVERLEYCDLYCPLGEAPSAKYRPEDAETIVREALMPLGDEYGEVLANAFRSRWIDWHPTLGKRSGAYATGWAYRAHPYVLLNFNDDHDSVMTLAHEMGHAAHSYFSNRDQAFASAAYSIFVAEVASTFNEALVRRHLFDRASTPAERLFLIGAYLDGIRGTLFRQTMFAEFELAIHERAERGEALTGERLGQVYLALLRRYHGHDEGVMHIDDVYAVEWAAIPHMYYDFYVYQYATGIVAASALARGVLENRGTALGPYLAFLSAGGSDYPLALLRRAGVDLEQADPFRETFDAVSEQLDLLEETLDAGGASAES